MARPKRFELLTPRFVVCVDAARPRRLQSRSKGARGRCHPRRTLDSADAPEALGNLLRLSVSWRFCPNNCPAKARPFQAVVRYAYVSGVSLVGVAGFEPATPSSRTRC